MRNRGPKLILGAWLACGIAVAVAAQGPAAGGFRNYEAPGNLESKHALDCIDLKSASPGYNPVDLFKGAKTCFAASRYDQAAKLLLLGRVYGRFDMLRVADETAHQAVTVAQMEAIGAIPQADQQKLATAVGALLSDPARHSAYCGDVARIGPPTYFPTYMIQHGMGAFLGRAGDGLIKGFNAGPAWGEVLTTYLKCVPRAR